MNNSQLYALAESYLDTRGAEAKAYCGMGSGAYCCAYVTYVFHKGGDSNLFYSGKRVVYVPSAESWLYANLANIPIYLAMPMDIITFDWNNNGTPDHIGFVRKRLSDSAVYTLEGNTSKVDKKGKVLATGVVAKRKRSVKYISGCFRPEFKGSFDTSKPLVIDGEFGYNSIASLQKVLKAKGVYKGKIDGILGKGTVKGLQKLAGVAQDGSWGPKTTKAIQKKLIKVPADGWWGEQSTKALQMWINRKNGFVSSVLEACPLQAEWMKNYKYKWNNHPTLTNSEFEGTCVTYIACVLQRSGYLKSGEAIWHNHGKVDGANSKMSVHYPKGTIKSLKSKLKKGCIVIAGDKNSMEAGGESHIFAISGKWAANGDPYIWDNNSATRIKKGKKGLHTYSGNTKVIAYIKLKG